MESTLAVVVKTARVRLMWLIRRVAIVFSITSIKLLGGIIDQKGTGDSSSGALSKSNGGKSCGGPD